MINGTDETDYPVYIIDGRTTLLADHGRAIVESAALRLWGEIRWVPPADASAAYFEGWWRLGRDVDGDVLLWLPTPAGGTQ